VTEWQGLESLGPQTGLEASFFSLRHCVTKGKGLGLRKLQQDKQEGGRGRREVVVLEGRDHSKPRIRTICLAKCMW